MITDPSVLRHFLFYLAPTRLSPANHRPGFAFFGPVPVAAGGLGPEREPGPGPLPRPDDRPPHDKDEVSHG